MKKIFTLYTALLLAVSINAQMTFCEDFESLTVGDPIAQSSPSWNSWDELLTVPVPTPPFIDDAAVVNTNAYSGSNSLYFLANPGPGPQDIILMFDTTQNITQSTLGGLSTPHVVGNITFSQMMNIRNGAYLNFQAENALGTGIGVWALEVNFDINPIDPTDPGTISMSNTTSTVPFTGMFLPNTWFEFKFEINLSNNIWELFIDGVSQGSFSNSVNKIASVDFYTRAADEYYIDDVCYDYIPATLPINNGQVSNISNITGLVGQTRYPSVEIRNFGIDPIYSCDVTFDYNGIQITENLTNIGSGFGLLSLNSMQVDFTNSITLITGTNPGTVTISNVNGALIDDDPSDDIMTTQITAITPAAGKLVIGEEATGTWCGWCPRGAVALNWMDHDYEGYWQGIAIHNGDPMADSIYDNGIGPLISGYPSGLVDRGNDINPANFKQDFLQRIVIPPTGIITNGAELNGNILKVSLTVDFQTTVNGNYKLACIIVEDSVTGIGPDYYQSNSYSGGASGPLVDVDGTDWANMPSNVPASSMIYRHVGRSISPSFTGEPLSATSYNLGDSETICYEFILDPLWDQSQIHIVGMLLDNSNIIDNASSESIDNSIIIGYSDCGGQTSISTELNGPDRINIYPNPATDNIYISNLTEAATLKMYDINGKLVLENKVSNKEYVNISHLSKGMYQIKFKGKDWSETRKLIKE